MSEIDSTIKRGSAELAVLSVLESGPRHGYEIARRIEQDTSGVLRFDVASLYPLLYRLEKDGLVVAKWEESAGRRRRCYQLTASGKKKLKPLREHWRAFFDALNQVARFQNA